MVRRRGAARTSSLRRRTYRTRVKWDPRIIPRRFKILLPMMTEELAWEIEILLLLEEDVYPYLEAQGVPTDQWLYYRDFAFRMWERRVHFNDATFQLEKQSLLNEFGHPVFGRGLNPTHLNAIQVFAELKAAHKITGEPAHPDYVCWWNSCETCDDWTVPPAIICSVDQVDFQEFGASIQLENNKPAVGADQECIKPVEACDWWVGWWFKGTFHQDTTALYMRIYYDDGSYHGVTFLRSDPGHWYNHHMWTPGDGGLTFGTWSFSDDTWYWIELYENRAIRTFYLRVNGVDIHNFIVGVGALGAYQNFRVTQPLGWRLGRVHIDYLRIADRWEYPPL